MKINKLPETFNERYHDFINHQEEVSYIINEFHIHYMQELKSTSLKFIDILILNLLREGYPICEIEDLLNYSNLSYCLKKMENKGYIYKMENPNDGRSPSRLLTEKGNEILNKIEGLGK